MKKAICKIDGCEAAYPGHRGFCAKHYQRFRRYGDPLIVRPQGWAPGDDRNPSKRPESRAALRALRTGKPLSEITRQRQGESLRVTLSRPDIKAKWRKAQTGRVHSPETRKRISSAHAKRPKKLSTLIHKADEIFSKYIRYSHADGRGNVRCFTCDAVKPIAETDCGHFVGRQHKATRWLEKNAHPQCRYCNRYNEGRKDVYAVGLMQKYGPNILIELQEQKNKIVHWSPSDLEELIETYKTKVKELDVHEG